MVRRFPVLGRSAYCGGTVFIERGRQDDRERALTGDPADVPPVHRRVGGHTCSDRSNNTFMIEVVYFCK